MLRLRWLRVTVLAGLLLAVGCVPALEDGILMCEPGAPSSCPDGFFCQLRPGAQGYRCYRAAGEFCGDGRIGVGETCDGEFLGSQRCQVMGWFAGVLACDSVCQLDDSRCVSISILAVGGYFVCGLDDRGQPWCWGGSPTETWPGAGGAEPWVPSPIPVPAPLTQLTAGGHHVCGLDAGGQAHCWGWNRSGQLGNGAAVRDRLTEGRVELVYGRQRFASLAAGRDHTCGLDPAGQAYCWGSGAGGQLGDGGGPDRVVPVPVVALPRLVALAAGALHTCALDEDGSVWCWGANAYGQLGTAAPSEPRGPVTAEAPAGLTALVAGDDHACALDGYGQPWCWGAGFAGQLSPGSTDWGSPTAVAVTERLLEITAGAYHTCGLTEGGALQCWGLGFGEPDGSEAVVIGEAEGWQGLSSGWATTCGTGQGDGLPRCFGLNTAGQLGMDPGSSVPSSVRSQARFAAIAAGGAVSCSLDEAGQAWCWGAAGVLGSGPFRPRITPHPVDQEPGIAFTEIAAGRRFACALSDTGRAYCWGENSVGQLGTGSLAGAPGAPVAVTGGQQITSIALGGNHGCALDASGWAWCWGDNGFGQLGLGDTASRSAPAAVEGAPALVALTTGWSHTCGLDGEGGLWCWGAGTEGQLGFGYSQSSPLPVRVIGESRFVSVTAGGTHTCAIDENEQAWCWEWADRGSTGTGEAMSFSFPRRVSGEHRFRALAAGREHTCGIAVGGETLCWGDGSRGQIGDGRRDVRQVPTRVVGDVSFASLSAGSASDHTCALDASGGAWCWGWNAYGQLGTQRMITEPALLLGP